MKNEELRGAVLGFIQSHHAEEKTAPSVGLIVRHLREVGLTRSGFYAVFHGGLSQACRAAGVPVPERLGQTRMALKAREKLEGDEARGNVVSQARLTLTEEQTRRLLGISHLEGGMDPTLVIDELIDRDSRLRKAYRLSFADTRLLADFLKRAVEGGWSIHSDPNIVGYVTDLWNLGMQNLDVETVKGLVGILKDLKSSGWDPARFVREATGASNLVHNYMRYRRGLMTAQEFLRSVSSI